MKTFESLEVWQSAKDLVMFTYSYFGNCRDYSFKDQICRASISVMNNIAEGYERDSVNEFIRFLKIAKGSCGEERSMLTIVVELGFVSS